MELIHRQVSRYAAFTVTDEAEAVSALAQAAPMMYKSPPKFTGFNEDGFLTGLEPPESDADDIGTDDWGAFIDETIHLATFDAGICLLTLELFDELMDPNEPLHSDNIVLAKMLERIAKSA